MKKKITLIISVLLIGIFLTYYFINISLNKRVENMTIQKAYLVKEVRDLLLIFQDEIQFFDYKVDDSIKAVSIDLWEYNQNEWENIGNVFSDINNLKENKNKLFRIGLKIDNNIFNIYNISNKKVSKSGYKYNVNFEDMMTTFYGFLLDTQKIEPNKEIVLYHKIGRKDDYLKMEDTIIDNFRNIKCDKGVVITITFLDKEIE